MMTITPQAHRDPVKIAKRQFAVLLIGLLAILSFGLWLPANNWALTFFAAGGAIESFIFLLTIFLMEMEKDSFDNPNDYAFWGMQATVLSYNAWTRYGSYFATALALLGIIIQISG